MVGWCNREDADAGEEGSFMADLALGLAVSRARVVVDMAGLVPFYLTQVQEFGVLSGLIRFAFCIANP